MFHWIMELDIISSFGRLDLSLVRGSPPSPSSKEPNLLNSLIGSLDPLDGLFVKPGLDEADPGLASFNTILVLGAEKFRLAMGVDEIDAAFEVGLVEELPPTAPRCESSSMVVCVSTVFRVFLSDEVSIIFATAIPLGHVTSVCVDTDLVDLTTDAYVNPGCPMETELDCCEYISFASLKETLRLGLILTIACCLFHSGHCLEYAV
jgi:hypothetical protein